MNFQSLHSRLLRLGSLLLVAALWPQLATAQTTVKYVHTDALGSVVAMTDASGAVVEGHREYEAYGQQLTPAVQDGPGYTGHIQDAATGLTYMQQRYYDPGIGRFLSVDPVTAYSSGDWRQLNRYEYAFNNPYKFTDPDGRNPIAGAAIGCAVTGPACPAGATVGAAVGTAVIVIGLGIVAYNEIVNDSAEPSGESSNTNPFEGPVDSPVVVVDGDGNAIPVGEGERIEGSDDRRYEQVKGRDGKPTGTRIDRGGHKGSSDPKARAPHGHQPGKTDETGNPHLPLNEPKPPPEPRP